LFLVMLISFFERIPTSPCGQLARPPRMTDKMG
jgi:hypothetical protein